MLYRYAREYNNIIRKIVGVYEANAKTTSRKRALLMQKMSLISRTIFIGGAIAYIFCIILHFLNPIYGYFWQNEFKALFPLYIAFIDENSVGGFIILVSIQTVQLIISIAAFTAVDYSFMTIAANCWIYSSIFEDNANELNEVLQNEKAVDSSTSNIKLRKMVEAYYDIWM